MIRLDKYISNCGLGSRKEVKILIRKGQVEVNGVVCRNDDFKIDENVDSIVVDGMQINYSSNVYIMLNKPEGYISATEDSRYPTVLELIDDIMPNDIFPVGRLDVDTEGLLLITNDGQFSHQLMSPKKHVSKKYYVELEKDITEDGIKKIEAGIWINEEEQCLPGSVDVIDARHIELTIYEGKFHQVKRMMHAIDNEVLYLKRVQIANLRLDETLDIGNWRYLTDEDFQELLGKED